MGTEKFCLKWNDFEANISHAFRDIRDTKDFLDVTLVCETDEQLQAHKVILSACSPFFRKILARNPHQHPLLYLKGVKFGDLQSVLNFMYHGEVNVAQDELNSFLAVAEELKVKGLTQNNSSSNNTNNVKSPPPSSSKPSRSMERETPASAPPAKRPRPSNAGSSSLSSSTSTPITPMTAPPHQPPPVADDDDDDDIQEVMPVKSEPGSNSSVIAGGGAAGGASAAAVGPPSYAGSVAGGEEMGEEEYGEEGEYEDYSGYGEGYDASVMDPNMTGGVDGNKGFIAQYINKNETQQSIHFTCTLCGKLSKDKSNLMRHIENIHFPDQFQYPCRLCPAVLPTKDKRKLSHEKRTQIRIILTT